MPAKITRKTAPPHTKQREKSETVPLFQVPKWALPVLVLITGLIYLRALSNGITNFDDDFYVTNNPYIKNCSWQGVISIFTHFYSGNYHPLTTLTLLLEYTLFGLNPFPYHFTNVALHLLNIVLAYKLAGKLSGKQLTALVVAMVFAIHPFHVESVAWISERKDVLYTAFYLSSLLVYIRYIDSPGIKTYAVCLLLFVASLMSKSAAVTLPVLLLLVDFYRSRRITARSVVEKIPFFALSLLFGVLNILSQAATESFGDMARYGLVNRLFLFTSGIAFYIVKLLLPSGLSVMHYFPILTGSLMPALYYLSLPLVALVVWFVFRRTPLRREWLFGFGFFMITVSVMLQVFAVGSALTAERYSYVPYIGLAYAIGQWMSDITQRGKYANMILGAFAALSVVFGVITFDRIGIWKDDHLLVEDMIQSNPDVYYGYWMRGNLEKKEGDLNNALADYSKAISINHRFEEAYYNRGIIYDNMGNFNAAIADYTKAIEVNPKMSEAYNNRGWAHFEANDFAAAKQDFDKAISLKPSYAEAFNNRGWASLQYGDINAALDDFSRAITSNPVYDKPYYNRAALRARLGDFNGSVADFSTVLHMHPEDGRGYYFRGMSYLSLKNFTAACADWNRSAQLGYADASGMLQQYCR